MGSQLQAQWDIGASTFSAAGALHALMKAATVDDVQPMAVVAIEAIGSCLEVDPYVTGRAIDVLGQSDSYRMENLKLTVGLSSGGIARQIRQSVPAVRVFALIASLLANHEVKEVADLLFEMLIHSGLHNKVASSRSQLRGLCAALQGHCRRHNEAEDEELQAWNTLLPLLASIAGPKSWFSLVPDEGAKIILGIFQALREDDLDHVVASGTNSGCWLAVILYQLLPGRLDILDDQENVVHHGNAGQTSRVKLRLRDNVITWSIKRVYKVERFTDILHIQFDESSSWFENGAERKVPGHVWPAATYVTLSASIHGFADAAFLDAVEIVTIGMILMLLKKELKVLGNTCQFEQICRPDFVQSLKHVFVALGWPSKPENFAVAMASKSPLPKPMESGPWALRDFVILLEGFDHVSIVKVDSTHGVLLKYVRCLMRYIVSHSISDLAFGMLQVPLRSVPEEIEIDKILWPDSLSFYTPIHFVQLILRSISSDMVPHNIAYVLATSSRGLVAYYRTLREVPVTQSTACSIVVQYGSLRWRNESYKYIIESIATRSSPEGTDTIVESGKLRQNDLLWRSSQATRFRIENYTEDILNWSCAGTRCGSQGVSYSVAMNMLATAKTLQGSHSSMQEDGQHHRHPIFGEQIALTNAWHRDKSRIVLTYSGEPLADFLRYGINVLRMRGDDLQNAVNSRYFIQGEANIQECILEAERLQPGGPWLIFSNLQKQNY